MRTRCLTAILLAGSLAFSVSAIGLAQSAPAPAAPAGGGLQVLDFKPGLDDLMTMMVQPRHMKLYFAAQQKNWTLAGFQLNELRASLRRIGQTIPKYRNMDFDAAVASIFAPKIQAMDAAIKSADAAQFTAAYGELTAACNACHVGMEHPFLEIKVPDAAAAMAFADQNFAPPAAPR